MTKDNVTPNMSFEIVLGAFLASVTRSKGLVQQQWFDWRWQPNLHNLDHGIAVITLIKSVQMNRESDHNAVAGSVSGMA